MVYFDPVMHHSAGYDQFAFHACLHAHDGESPPVQVKQEMSQTCDECPQRNWSSIRHI